MPRAGHRVNARQPTLACRRCAMSRTAGWVCWPAWPIPSMLEVVEALEDSDFATIGQLFNASQTSMRDDFEITTEHIDLIADTAVAAGALGARMTGGGFGGCVIALAPAAKAEHIADAVRVAVAEAGYNAPTIIRTRAGQGAELLR